MDSFERTLYKYAFKKSESQHENTNFYIEVNEARGPIIKREAIKYMVSLLQQ